jgi:16S rRNA (guanine1207-N2)-methyltransferase
LRVGLPLTPGPSPENRASKSPSPFLTLLATARPRLRPPIAVVLGAPRLVADLVTALGLPDTTCYQMDLHQAGRLRDELREIGTDASVEVRADLWDLPPDFNTVLYPSPPRGERELKRDMAEQAYHLLRPRGRLVVLSPVAKDQFYPAVMKKAFGKVALEARRAGTMLWSPRGANRPRRRHEIAFHVRLPGEPGASAPGAPFADASGSPMSLTFVSRPGVFTYGRMDDGARALVEVAEVQPGDKIVDLGCGTGAVGVIAGLRARPDGRVTFVDSNVRATALAEINARANGLTGFRVVADAQMHGLRSGRFDLALANPPYYAQQGVARLFIEAAARLLRPGGRLYLVTKQADVVGEIMREVIGDPAVVKRRDYAVLFVRKR